MQDTPNHNLNKYEYGDSWNYNTDMDHIEELLVVRDVEANLANYTPHNKALFVATDTGAVYDGDGTNWNAATRELAGLTLSGGLNLSGTNLEGVRSSATALAAADLSIGEVALDEANGRLVWKDASGSAYYATGTSLA